MPEEKRVSEWALEWLEKQIYNILAAAIKRIRCRADAGISTRYIVARYS